MSTPFWVARHIQLHRNLFAFKELAHCFWTLRSNLRGGYRNGAKTKPEVPAEQRVEYFHLAYLTS